MSDVIIVAIITGSFTVIGNFFLNRSKDAQREQKQLDSLEDIKKDIQRLEKKVDIHNGYAEKLGDISKSMVAMQKDIEYLKKEGK